MLSHRRLQPQLLALVALVPVLGACSIAGAVGASGRQPSGLIVFDGITNNGPGYEQLYVANLGNGRVRQVTKSGSGGYNPSWSPDGSHIAFEWDSKGPCGSLACSRVFIVAADGSGRHPFTPPNLRCESPAWSPRGNQIAYVQWGKGSYEASIYARSLGGQVRRLTHAKNVFDSDPVWSPDGTRIIFSREQGDSYTNYVMDAHGKHLHPLGGNPDTTITSWSPDGRLLAGSTVWGPYNNNYLSSVLNANGTEKRRLLTDGGDPVWSPDGSVIAFVPDDQDIFRGSIDVVSANGKGRHRLFASKLFTQPGNLDWLPRP